MSKYQRMKSALEDVEVWLHDAAPDTAAGELLITVRAALSTRKKRIDTEVCGPAKSASDSYEIPAFLRQHYK